MSGAEEHVFDEVGVCALCGLCDDPLCCDVPPGCDMRSWSGLIATAEKISDQLRRGEAL